MTAKSLDTCGQARPLGGISELAIERQRTLMHSHGRKTHDLQNRLRGAAEASWVGSIPLASIRPVADPDQTAFER